MNRFLTHVMLATMLLPLSAMGQAKTADPAPIPVPMPAPVPVHLTEVQQLQIEARIKDFQILQLEFAQLVMQVKQANGWGDDVLWDSQRSAFYRVAKPATEKEPQPLTKSALPERKK